jgi:ribulose-5-phosphate 4-epimerase/fuculose-1-phosphate aldolase
MRGHGAVTVGDTPEDAVVQMMRLEEQAKLNVLAYQTVGAKYQGIPQDQVKEYIARYSRNSTATLPVIGSTAAYEYLAAQVTPLDT